MYTCMLYMQDEVLPCVNTEHRLVVADSHPSVPKQHHQAGARERDPQEADLRPRGCGELLLTPFLFFCSVIPVHIG